jgi:hypothetical protein
MLIVSFKLSIPTFLQNHQEMIKGTETRRDGTVEFPAHVLFKVELTELQNCTSAYVLLQQVNEIYLVYRFQLVALNLLAVYDVETNNKVSLHTYAICFRSALCLCTTLFSPLHHCLKTYDGWIISI